MAEREGLLAAYPPLVPSLSLGTAVAELRRHPS
jgi:hypothetical protein